MGNKSWDVAAADELKAGQMKEVQAGERKLLLANVNGTLHAVDAACPHYGASLAEGLLCGERVICPWHKSCFRVTDGALLEPPALDDLRSYPVEIRDGRVNVQVSEENPVFVIVGAGAAGVSAAETLRRDGFEGRVILISQEGGSAIRPYQAK